ncbi:MAG: serine/threonine protein kinase [Armatimonadetes bacterium]|nr:serine/threonine protein kinase [Armatimonadota bacterium]
MGAVCGQTLKKRYEIKSAVASGGMGAVFLAHDRALDIKVAVKELFDRSSEARAQFEREAKILAKLSHPALPRVTDWFLEGRVAFLVMDFVEGQDLQAYMTARGRGVSEERAVEWTLQLLDVLDYIHANHVVHRDLKPANVRLTPAGKLVLVDFGIARQGGGMTSPFARGACTPAIAPPEQCTVSGRTGPESDLYALGVTLYFLLTGAYPPDAMSRLMGMDVPSVGRLDGVIARAMALDTADRFQSAAEMAQALRSAVGTPRAAAPAPVAVPQAVAPMPAAVFRREIRRM